MGRVASSRTNIAGVLVVLTAVLAGCGSVVSSSAPCPKKSDGFRSKDGGSKTVSVSFHTDAEEGMHLVWVDLQGKEVEVGEAETHGIINQDSSPGHAFRIYTAAGNKADRSLMKEYTLTQEKDQQVFAKARPDCQAQHKDTKDRKLKQIQERAEELEALIHPGGEDDVWPECGPKGQSQKWSCIRRIPREECSARHQNNKEFTEGNSFGFAKEMNKWKVGSYEDRQYDWQIPKIPLLTSGPGFLKMNMTKALQEALIPWFNAEWKKGNAPKESPVPGGYLNDKFVPSSLLRTSSSVNRVINAEMRAALEWWIGTELRHTSTFGVRVYHRGNVLLNHVDRYDTHLASAILQVYQDVDENGGWPVEVLSDDRNCYEIYMQPGEMLLYEGAHFKHGRPMEFRGNAFGNCFVHFAPKEWYGPGKEL